jgi:WbqC-like protein family
VRAVVLQSNYLPWKGYFDLIQSADVFVHYDEVQYTKNDWRNRNRVCSKNGVHWLTIPVSREAVKLKISEVRLPDPRWQDDHFKTLSESYRPAPFFSQIEPLLDEFYKRRTWTLLSELNRHCTERIASLLGLTTRFLDSKDFSLAGDRVERLVSLLQQIGATEYLSGPSARDYLAGSERLFEQAGIRLLFKSYAGYPEYRQLHVPFEHAVSIVDVLANVELADCRRCITAAGGTVP